MLCLRHVTEFFLPDHNHSPNENDLEPIAMPALPGYYTTKEAAERLGYKDGTYLKTLCNSGKISASKVGKTWLIPEAWVLEQEKTSPRGQGNRGVDRK